MDQMIARWYDLELRQQVIAGLSFVAVVSGLWFVVQVATQAEMKLLYSNLPAAGSGEVIAALDAEGIDYEIRGSAIYVPATAARSATSVPRGAGPACQWRGRV